MSTDSAVSDTGRLLFGAGFVFGVAVTMVIMAVVTATVAGSSGGAFLTADIVLTIGGGIVFAAIVGVSLWVLAFPENRLYLPLSGLGLPAGDASSRRSGDQPDEADDDT